MQIWRQCWRRFCLVVASAGSLGPALADGDVAGNAFLRENLKNLSDEVAAYRPSLQSMAKEPKIARESKEVLTRIDALMDSAARLARQTQLAEAVKQGEQARQLAIEAMVRLRAGETVTHALKFDTPADEYAYELRRYDSNEMLVGMNLNEAHPSESVHAAVDRSLAEARRLKREAEGLAGGGRHGDAVKRLEAASQQLTRALQTLGVPVF